MNISTENLTKTFNKFIYINVFIWIFLVNFSITNASELDPNNDLKCESFVLIDGKTGAVLSSKNPDFKLYPASTTKIMTAIVALENGDLNRKFVASDNAVNNIGRDGMNIGIVPSEELRLEDLLNALLVRSANETANIIAENISPSEKDFVALMNTKALHLGASSTHFVNPIGIDMDVEDSDHLTTAYDMAKIAQYAMTLPKFREIVVKRIAKIPPTNKFPKERFIGSTNKLLYPSYKSQFYSQITGIKTGFTNKAGHNLVSSAIDKDGNELISVIFGVRSDNVFQMSKDLLEYGFKNFSPICLQESNKLVKNIFISDKPGEKVSLCTQSEIKSMFPTDNEKYKWTISKKEYINSNIKLPIKKGEILGNIEYFVNNIPVGKVNLVSNTDVIEVNTFLTIFTKFASNKFAKNLFLSILFCILAVLCLRFCLPKLQSLVIQRKRHKTKSDVYNASMSLFKAREYRQSKNAKRRNLKHYKKHYY